MCDPAILLRPGDPPDSLHLTRASPRGSGLLMKRGEAEIRAVDLPTNQLTTRAEERLMDLNGEQEFRKWRLVYWNYCKYLFIKLMLGYSFSVIAVWLIWGKFSVGISLLAVVTGSIYFWLTRPARMARKIGINC